MKRVCRWCTPVREASGINFSQSIRLWIGLCSKRNAKPDQNFGRILFYQASLFSCKTFLKFREKRTLPRYWWFSDKNPAIVLLAEKLLGFGFCGQFQVLLAAYTTFSFY